jgi:hypothetical protein
MDTAQEVPSCSAIIAEARSPLEPPSVPPVDTPPVTDVPPIDTSVAEPLLPGSATADVKTPPRNARVVWRKVERSNAMLAEVRRTILCSNSISLF